MGLGTKPPPAAKIAKSNIDEANFEGVTRLNREMEICTKYLHKPHSYYLNLSLEDKTKLLLKEEFDRRRSIYEYEKGKQKIDAGKTSS